MVMISRFDPGLFPQPGRVISTLTSSAVPALSDLPLTIRPRSDVVASLLIQIPSGCKTS
jgi:hypothetical protein